MFQFWFYFINSWGRKAYWLLFFILSKDGNLNKCLKRHHDLTRVERKGRHFNSSGKFLQGTKSSFGFWFFGFFAFCRVFFLMVPMHPLPHNQSGMMGLEWVSESFQCRLLCQLSSYHHPLGYGCSKLGLSSSARWQSDMKPWWHLLFVLGHLSKVLSSGVHIHTLGIWSAGVTLCPVKLWHTTICSGSGRVTTPFLPPSVALLLSFLFYFISFFLSQLHLCPMEVLGPGIKSEAHTWPTPQQ